MRSAEWINLVYFAFLGALSFLMPLPRSRRLAILLIGLAGIWLVVTAQFLERFFSPLIVSVARDWLPAPLIIAAYWQGGLFFYRPKERVQSLLESIDRRLFKMLEQFGGRRRPAWVATYFETAYLFCYPFVPMGIGALYLLHMGRYSDKFWGVVLPPTYLCYALLPFLPTLPPWMAEGRQLADSSSKNVRAANFLILNNLSIKANTFPSGHVAASIATALALLDLAPPVGLVFLWGAISIAVSTVAGRYHYALDAVLGAILAVAAFLLEKGLSHL